MDKAEILRQPFFIFQNKILYLKEIVESTDLKLIPKGDTEFRQGALVLVTKNAKLVVGCSKRGITREKIDFLEKLIFLLKELFSRDDFDFLEFKKIISDEDNLKIIRPLKQNLFQ